MSKKEVNKSIKKRILWILLAVLILVVSVLNVQYAIFVNKVRSVERAYSWSCRAEYEQYTDDFNLVKDYIATEFPDEDDKWLSVSYDDEKRIRVFDPDIMEYLTLPNDVASSLDTIRRNGFPRENFTLDVIRIHKGIISFCVNQGRYALVYSPNKKPTWVNSPYNYERVEVKKIQDGWYHVVNKDYTET